MKTLSVFFFLLLITTQCSVAPTSASVQEISAQEICDKKDQRKVQLIDVRTAPEFEEGHIKGAANIDVKQPEQFTEQAIQLDKNKPVMVYCRTGRRSTIAAEKLKEMGFKDIQNYTGGIVEWTNLKLDC